MQDTICANVDSNVSEHVVLDAVSDKAPYGEFTGSTKWFNDKLGYGFITICDGDDKGKDIFVHHSGINPLNSNYKTLRKGEYIQFNIVNGINGLQAVDVTGIKGGPLMCDYVTSKRLVSGVQSYTDDYSENQPQPVGWQTIAKKPKVYQGTPQIGSSRPQRPPLPPMAKGQSQKYNKNVVTKKPIVISPVV